MDQELDLTPFPVRNSLGFHLQRVAFRLRQAGNAAFRDHGRDITMEQWGVLALLWERDGRTPVELAGHLCKDKPNITRLVDALVDRGFLERRPDPDDGRSYRVFLRPEGRTLRDVLLPIPTAVLERAFRGCSSGQVAEFRRMLETIWSNMA